LGKLPNKQPAIAGLSLVDSPSSPPSSASSGLTRGSTRGSITKPRAVAFSNRIEPATGRPIPTGPPKRGYCFAARARRPYLSPSGRGHKINILAKGWVLDFVGEGISATLNIPAPKTSPTLPRVPPSDTLPAVAARRDRRRVRGKDGSPRGRGSQEGSPPQADAAAAGVQSHRGPKGRSGTSLRAETAERGAERCHIFILPIRGSFQRPVRHQPDHGRNLPREGSVMAARRPAPPASHRPRSRSSTCPDPAHGPAGNRPV